MLEVTSAAQAATLGISMQKYRRTWNYTSRTPVNITSYLYYNAIYSFPNYVVCPMYGMFMETTLVILAKPLHCCEFTTVIALMLGKIFSDMGSKRTNQQDLFNAIGSMYAAILFIIVQTATSVLPPVVSIEQTVFYRERAAGMYSTLPYAFGQVVIAMIEFECILVFRLQVNNGIPIKSWFSDPSDCALISLLPFLETLADAEDVRPIIAKRFAWFSVDSTTTTTTTLPNPAEARSNEDIYNGVIQKCHSNRFVSTSTSILTFNK
ncbi:pleiotropic drug resistance protein 1-like protein [Tanacetum coccineum]|uniref:Pleiotropic drug resistance protein 1-like protein n=1 Tax=Tanacetum coccineum TaxID=301880 RepID=A0ABQ4YZB3_9ASTR